MGLTSGIAKLVSLIWIGAVAWSIDRVSKLRGDEPWETPVAAPAGPSRTLPFEGVALAGTPGGSDLGSQAFDYRSAAATRSDAPVEELRFDAIGEPPALVAETSSDRILPALLQMAPPIVEEIVEPESYNGDLGEAVLAIGPVEEPPADEPLHVRSGGTAEVAKAADAGAAPTDAAAPAADAEQSYRVVRGDTLHRIAKRKFGSAEPGLIQAIFEANPELKKHPNKLKVGSEVRLPTWPPGAAMSGGRGSLVRS